MTMIYTAASKPRTQKALMCLLNTWVVLQQKPIYASLSDIPTMI